MRILVLHDPYKPIVNGSVGGEDNLVQLEIEQLSKLGNEVVDARTFDSGGIRKFNQLRAQSYGSHMDVLSTIQRTNPDVIHTHNLSQRSGYKWMKQTDVPIVSSIHNYRLFCASSIAWRGGNNCFECRDKSALAAFRHQCDGVRGAINATRLLVLQPTQPQINSPKMFLTGSEMMNMALSPIIPVKKMRILRNPGLAIKRRQNPSRSRKGWLFAGRFVEEKGVIDLIKNWPPFEHLDLAGSGPLSEKILGLIESRPHIRMIGTFPPGTLEIYYGYEGLIFPSTWLEGSPLVIADALSTGTPVIALDVSAAKEQVELSRAGVIVENGYDVTKLQSAFKNIRNNSETYSRNALAAAETHFSIENWTSSLNQYLSEATSL